MLTRKKQNIRIETGKNGFEKIQNDWSELTKKINNKRFFHYFEWYESYIEALEKNLEALLFIVMENCSEAEAIIPLKKIKSGCFDILELPDHNHLPLRDIIFPECFQTKNSINNLVESLQSFKKLKWDFMRLSCLLPDSCALKAFNKYSGPKVVRKLSTCCYIPLQSFEKFEANLSKNMCKQLKRARKKARALGEMQNRSFQTVTELAKAFPVFLDIEASGWKGIKGSGSAIKCNDNLIKFYKILLNKFSKFGESRIDILYIDERPISGELQLCINDTSYSLKGGIDEAMRHISPGQLHRELLLKTYSREQKIKYFNLVSGEYIQDHKRWKASSHDTYEVIIFNRTFKALPAFSYLQAKEIIKPFYKSYAKSMLKKTPFCRQDSANFK